MPLLTKCLYSTFNRNSEYYLVNEAHLINFEALSYKNDLKCAELIVHEVEYFTAKRQGRQIEFDFKQDFSYENKQLKRTVFYFNLTVRALI